MLRLTISLNLGLY